MIVQIFGDDLNATYTPATTGYEKWPGSSLLSVNNMDNNYMYVDSTNSSGLYMVVGNKGKGTWRVGWEGSWTAAVANKDYHIAMFKNGTKLAMTSRDRTIGTGGDYGVAMGSGYTVLNSATDTIDVRIKSTSAGTQITVSHINIWAEFKNTSTKLT